LLFVGFGIVGVGVLVALATDLGLTLLTPAKFGLAVGGFALLIPTMVMEDPKAYWLFLLVLSIPFDFSKWLSAGLVDPHTLVDEYGMPASGTVALELYLTDVVLVAMLLSVGSPFDAEAQKSPRKSVSLLTRRWRKQDSNRRSPVTGTTRFETAAFDFSAPSRPTHVRA